MKIVKDKPLVSVILPIYNTGAILEKTFDSIVNQDYQNIELIMIDDGSNCETAALADKLAQKDERVTLIHQDNLGTCAARNYGLRLAKGDYITFCDHDDEYSNNLILTEVQAVQERDYDIVVIGKNYIFDNKSNKYFGCDFECSDRNESQKFFLNLIANHTASTVWNVLYKKSVVKGILFNEELRKGQEDILFNLNIIKNINSIKSVDKCLYMHYVRNGMSTSAGLHRETLTAMGYTIEKIAGVIQEISVEERNDIVAFQGSLLKTYVMYAVKLGVSAEEFKKCVKELNVYRIDINAYQIKSMDGFFYYLVYKEKLDMMYYTIKIYSTIKRIQTGAIKWKK